MQKLQDIAVRVEATDGLPLNHSNATPIMHEILHALRKLAAQGESTTIDLQAIPFGPGDEEDLLDLLGTGEITVELNSLGSSIIRESAYSGVWIIDHRNADDQRIALHIDIAQVPMIIRSQPEDVADALHRLEDQLNLNRTETAGLTPDYGRSSDG
jgi:hydrogenase-1 operon protein HyaF